MGKEHKGKQERGQQRRAVYLPLHPDEIRTEKRRRMKRGQARPPLQLAAKMREERRLKGRMRRGRKRLC